jgi:hypothetical protein
MQVAKDRYGEMKREQHRHTHIETETDRGTGTGTDRDRDRDTDWQVVRLCAQTVCFYWELSFIIESSTKKVNKS